MFTYIEQSFDSNNTSDEYKLSASFQGFKQSSNVIRNIVDYQQQQNKVGGKFHVIRNNRYHAWTAEKIVC